MIHIFFETELVPPRQFGNAFDVFKERRADEENGVTTGSRSDETLAQHSVDSVAQFKLTFV